MRYARPVWVVFAVAVACWGVFVGTEPMYQISSCEIVGIDDACGSSIFAMFGVRFAVLAAATAGLCAVPAIGRWSGWGWVVAAVLAGVSTVAAGFDGTLPAVMAYYLPAAPVACGVAVWQRWISRRTTRRTQTSAVKL